MCSSCFILRIHDRREVDQEKTLTKDCVEWTEKSGHAKPTTIKFELQMGLVHLSYAFTANMSDGFHNAFIAFIIWFCSSTSVRTLPPYGLLPSPFFPKRYLNRINIFVLLGLSWNFFLLLFYVALHFSGSSACLRSMQDSSDKCISYVAFLLRSLQ